MRKILICLVLLELSLAAHVYHPHFFNEEELNHVRFGRDEGMKPCDEDTLMNFLAEIQVINPESIIKLATYSEIDSSCRKVSENLEKIKNYLKDCEPPTQEDLYYQLIRGVESLHGKLCISDSPFRKKYSEVHQCIHELQNDLEDCGGPADWNENSDNEAVCKAYKDIADCYYIKVAKVCGNDAADSAKALLKAVVDSIITIDCANVKKNPSVKDAMPEKYLRRTNKAINLNVDGPSVYVIFVIILLLTINII